jgi:hypothetical protein
MIVKHKPTVTYVNTRSLFDSYHHGLINYIKHQGKMASSKNWPVKGLCGRCLSEFMYCSQSC